MKKTMIVAVISLVLGAIASPILGMAINPTRDLILGMAPDQAVIKLADKIDENNNNSETKIQEMQATIDSQKAQLDEQQKNLDDQKTNINEQQNNNDVAQKNSQCALLQSKYTMCNNKARYTQSWNDFLKEYKKQYTYGGHEFNSEDLADATKNYAICQDVYKQCN